ncbi:hypothetical protein TrLO_g1726 [Triparma laevis f. longispina]|uniref:Uncharacterized protein n=1 Tax=Triparma laevis f. longispina TaxID=1714387 RepID=A0A9W6ZTS7_9STRA|nr:hypothetical protein TrLO_g1726 [Triparma laevis f. longispina]
MAGSLGTAAEISTTTTTVSTVPATSDQFMHTPEFRRHFVEFVHVQTLMALRVATKGWNAVADALTDEGVKSEGVKSVELMVHGGKDISDGVAYVREEKRALVTRVIFLLNIPKIRERACKSAVNLVVVDIPEGVERIGERAFAYCRSLTTLSFPKTLTSIASGAFAYCASLENVDLLHTNLQGLGDYAFAHCPELKSMTIPDSLQSLGRWVFANCRKLVPSNTRVECHGYNQSTENAVVAHLRSQQ